MPVHQIDDELRRQELVHAIRGEHEQIANFHWQRLVVDLELGIDAERTTQIAAILRLPRHGDLR